MSKDKMPLIGVVLLVMFFVALFATLISRANSDSMRIFWIVLFVGFGIGIFVKYGSGVFDGIKEKLGRNRPKKKRIRLILIRPLNFLTKKNYQVHFAAQNVELQQR